MQLHLFFSLPPLPSSAHAGTVFRGASPPACVPCSLAPSDLLLPDSRGATPPLASVQRRTAASRAAAGPRAAAGSRAASRRRIRCCRTPAGPRRLRPPSRAGPRPPAPPPAPAPVRGLLCRRLRAARHLPEACAALYGLLASHAAWLHQALERAAVRSGRHSGRGEVVDDYVLHAMLSISD